jgi:hypothetical protein
LILLGYEETSRSAGDSLPHPPEDRVRQLCRPLEKKTTPPDPKSVEPSECEVNLCGI